LTSVQNIFNHQGTKGTKNGERLKYLKTEKIQPLFFSFLVPWWFKLSLFFLIFDWFLQLK